MAAEVQIKKIQIEIIINYLDFIYHVVQIDLFLP